MRQLLTRGRREIAWRRPGPSRLVRVALVCYLSPVIVLVFVVGILMIGTSRLIHAVQAIGGLVRGRASFAGEILMLPTLPRRSGVESRPTRHPGRPDCHR